MIIFSKMGSKTPGCSRGNFFDFILEVRWVSDSKAGKSQVKM
jgi:hypothetical protein